MSYDPEDPDYEPPTVRNPPEYTPDADRPSWGNVGERLANFSE